MAYNNYFPATYPQVQMPINNAPQAQIQPQNGIVWVQGIEGAKAHYVPAGGNALLMDSDGQFMYIKSADNAGMPTLRTFKYEEVTENAPVKEEIDMSAYVTREEFDKAIASLRKKGKKHESTVHLTE